VRRAAATADPRRVPGRKETSINWPCDATIARSVGPEPCWLRATTAREPRRREAAKRHLEWTPKAPVPGILDEKLVGKGRTR